MNKSYDVYMCRPDNRPTLTIDNLKQFQTTMSGGWYQSVDIHTAIERARNAGYKVPFDIFQSYLAEEQKRRADLLANCSNASKRFHGKGMSRKALDWLLGK